MSKSESSQLSEVVTSQKDYSAETLKPSKEITATWKQVHKALRGEFGEAVFRSWLKPLTLQAFYHGTMEVSVPTRFMKDWVQTHYAKRILEMACEKSSEIKRLEIVVVQNAIPLDDSQEAPKKSNENKKPAIDQFEIASPLDQRFTFDSFVVGKPNALAHAAARRVVESASVPFNPLFIYGGVGLGKTHLMHSIAWMIGDQAPEKQVMYLSAEKFMYQFVKALRSNETMAFKEFFRSVDVLMIDDIQFIAGKESTQEEFFHTFNALVDQILALKVTSNIRELEGALNRIVAHAEVSRNEITLESTQEVLQDLLRSHDRRITIDEIQRKVAEHYNIRLSDMHSARRARAVARPRQVAMYLSKQLTARSLPEIGRKFGGRDHTTVMHAVRKIEELSGEDPSFAQDVDVLKRALTG